MPDLRATIYTYFSLSFTPLIFCDLQFFALPPLHLQFSQETFSSHSFANTNYGFNIGKHGPFPSLGAPILDVG
jgi:hypothetical protein